MAVDVHGRVWLLALALALLPALALASAARADAPVRTSGTGMLVLVEGCPGFVAAGGLAPSPGTAPPYAYSWTHNFSADWAQTAQSRFQNDPTGQKTEQAIDLEATGTDAAGHGFAIKGKLFLHLLANPDLWADGGTVRIRRDDGAVVSGTAVGDGFLVFDPIFTVDQALVVTASTCRLP